MISHWVQPPAQQLGWQSFGPPSPSWPQQPLQVQSLLLEHDTGSCVHLATVVSPPCPVAWSSSSR